MLAPSLGLVLLASATFVECGSVLDTRHFHGLRALKRQNDPSTSLTLTADAVQSGSFADGSDATGIVAAGQSKSATSQDNFINICAGKTLTNGLQVVDGSCNGIPMGDIPSKSNMVSSMITFPLVASTDIESGTTFQIKVQMSNFVPGSFTNAQSTYYAGPQSLSGGKVVGHTHITVQDLGASLNPKQPLDATKFVFFKGINDVGNGNGLLSATVTGGLPAGNYRVCTMASASNHQPVLMPVAQRGTPDDCTKFSVVESGSGNTPDETSSSEAPTSTSIVVKNEASSTTRAFAETTSITAANTTTSAIAETTTSEAPTATTESIDDFISTSTTELIADTTVVDLSTSSTALVVETTRAPFANNTIAATTTRRGGGKGGNKGGKGGNKGGNKGATSTPIDGQPAITTANDEATTTKVLDVDTTALLAVTTTTPINVVTTAVTPFTSKKNGGKGYGRTKTIKIVHKVTIIKTFFGFKQSLGGMPPSVGKKGNKFAVLDDIFDDFTSACDAACGHQYQTCISFEGSGFSFRECRSQRNSCGSAATSAVITADAPKTLTVTVTVPPSASVTGSIISEETVSTTVVVQTTSAAGVVDEAVVTPAPVGSPSEVGGAQPSAAPAPAANSPIAENDTDPNAAPAPAPLQSASPNPNPVCAVVTTTVTVERSATATPTMLATILKPPFSNSTATITSPAADPPTSSVSESTPVTSSAPAIGSAVGGIAAPAIIDSGDATRPFSVNGNTFVNEGAAIQRSCDVQFNLCANAVNSGSVLGVTVDDCAAQKSVCGK